MPKGALWGAGRQSLLLAGQEGLSPGREGTAWYPGRPPGPLEPSTPQELAPLRTTPVPLSSLGSERPQTTLRLGPVQATPPAPPCYWPRPLLPPAPHTALRGAGLPRPGAQPPKPSRKRTEGIGALSVPLPGPCDLISWGICSRASHLLMPACYLASAEKPPSRLASVLAPVGARDSVPGAKSWGSWGPADPSLVWRSC